MKNNALKLTDKKLKSLNLISSSPKLLSQIRKIDKRYNDFKNFIIDYEKFINSNLAKIDIQNYSYEDAIFELIINRLEFLSKYKKLSIKIYLECQKNNQYFFIITPYLNKYFNSISNRFFDKFLIVGLYAFSFNLWIEDDSSLDKTMASLGMGIEYIKKIKTFKL